MVFKTSTRCQTSQNAYKIRRKKTVWEKIARFKELLKLQILAFTTFPNLMLCLRYKDMLDKQMTPLYYVILHND